MQSEVISASHRKQDNKLVLLDCEYSTVQYGTVQ